MKNELDKTVKAMLTPNEETGRVMNKEFNPCESKKCTIDNLHPNWKNQELLEDANSVAQQLKELDK